MVGLHIRATALRTCFSPPTTSTPTYLVPSICCVRSGKATRMSLILWGRWLASLPAVIGHGSLIAHRHQFQIYLLASLAVTVVQRCSLQLSRHARFCTGPLPEGSHGQGLRIFLCFFFSMCVYLSDRFANTHLEPDLVSIALNVNGFSFTISSVHRARCHCKTGRLGSRVIATFGCSYSQFLRFHI